MLRTTLYKQSFYNKFIFFEDPNIQNWAITNFDKDHDGLLTKEDLALVTDAEFNVSGIDNLKYNNFPEFQYFISLRNITTSIGFNSTIQNIILPPVPITIQRIKALNIIVNSEVKAVQNFYCTNLYLEKYANVNKLRLKDIFIFDTGTYIVSHDSINYKKINNCLISNIDNTLLGCDCINIPVEIPNIVTKIPGLSILNNKFTSIKIPNEASLDIGSHFSFMYVTTVDIGENVKSIAHYFCYNCSKLQKVIFRGKVQKFFSPTTAFDWMHRFKPFTIYVKDEDIEYYKGLFKAPYNTYIKSITELQEN